MAFGRDKKEEDSGLGSLSSSTVSSAPGEPLTLGLPEGHPSSTRMIAGAYGTTNVGCCGRHTTVQL